MWIFHFVLQNIVKVEKIPLKVEKNKRYRILSWKFKFIQLPKVPMLYTHMELKFYVNKEREMQTNNTSPDWKNYEFPSEKTDYFPRWKYYRVSFQNIDFNVLFLIFVLGWNNSVWNKQGGRREQ